MRGSKAVIPGNDTDHLLLLRLGVNLDNLARAHIDDEQSIWLVLLVVMRPDQDLAEFVADSSLYESMASCRSRLNQLGAWQADRLVLNQ